MQKTHATIRAKTHAKFCFASNCDKPLITKFCDVKFCDKWSEFECEFVCFVSFCTFFHWFLHVFLHVVLLHIRNWSLMFYSIEERNIAATNVAEQICLGLSWQNWNVQRGKHRAAAAAFE